MSSNTLPLDFKARRSAHQTLRDRAHLKAAHQVSESEHRARVLKTEFRGGLVFGFLWGAGLVGFFWLLQLWVDVGGAP